jgi:hypothetical protein
MGVLPRCQRSLPFLDERPIAPRIGIAGSLFAYPDAIAKPYTAEIKRHPSQGCSRRRSHALRPGSTAAGRAIPRYRLERRCLLDPTERSGLLAVDARIGPGL